MIKQVFFVAVLCSLSLNIISASNIHIAVTADDEDAVQTALAKSSSSINTKDANGNTPLHLAAEKKNAQIVKLLLAKGANALVQNKAEKTPLCLAIENQFEDGVDALIRFSDAAYLDPILDVRQPAGNVALKNGVMEKAGTILARLVMKNPGNQNVNFAYGLVWLSLGDPSPAGTAFERVLLLNPNNNRARVELARARMLAKRYPEARRELEQVLAADLPADVQKTVELCLQEAKQSMNKWFFSANVELGALYDDNANVGPSSRNIKVTPIFVLGNLVNELTLSEKSKPKDSFGAYLSVNARGFYDIGEPNGWLLVSDFGAYMNCLEEDDYETYNLQAGIGLRKMLPNGFAQLPFRIRYVDYGGDSLVTTYGIYPSCTFAPASLERTFFTTLATVELRDFTAKNDVRDSTYLAISESARKTFAKGRYGVFGGVELQHDHADSEEYEYSGVGLVLGADAQLPSRFGVFGEARYYYKEYKDKNWLSVQDRSDDQYQLSAGFTRNMTDRWAVSGTHSIIHNHSTFDLYDYKRQITTFSTTVKF